MKSSRSLSRLEKLPGPLKPLAWVIKPEEFLGARRAEVGDWGRDQVFEKEDEEDVAGEDVDG